MRLIHTSSLQFEEFFDSTVPKYVILSHRWDAKEISYQEFRKSKKKSGAGFSKINKFCSLAKREGFKRVWIDTCCIDKKSSAELSEAINSMYRWYQDSEACYVYLSDVLWEDENISSSLAKFRQSVWFTRGWTLQELLAPQTVFFLDSEWDHIGEKKDLLKDISAVTGISNFHLNTPSVASVATKMSWASKRQTSRTEDVAYCLMGLFKVNMPLLYGEGTKAFLRLQLEIIKKSDDESIFAWTSIVSLSGMFATTPLDFAGSRDIVRNPFWDRPPYSMTNRGLEFHVLSSNGPFRTGEGVEMIKLQLNCRKAADKDRGRITIYLQNMAYGWGRVNCRFLDRSEECPEEPGEHRENMEAIYVYQDGFNGT